MKTSRPPTSPRVDDGYAFLRFEEQLVLLGVMAKSDHPVSIALSTRHSQVPHHDEYQVSYALRAHGIDNDHELARFYVLLRRLSTISKHESYDDHIILLRALMDHKLNKRSSFLSRIGFNIRHRALDRL